MSVNSMLAIEKLVYEAFSEVTTLTSYRVVSGGVELTIDFVFVDNKFVFTAVLSDFEKKLGAILDDMGDLRVSLFKPQISVKFRDFK